MGSGIAINWSGLDVGLSQRCEASCWARQTSHGLVIRLRPWPIVSSASVGAENAKTASYRVIVLHAPLDGCLPLFQPFLAISQRSRNVFSSFERWPRHELVFLIQPAPTRTTSICPPQENGLNRLRTSAIGRTRSQFKIASPSASSTCPPKYGFSSIRSASVAHKSI